MSPDSCNLEISLLTYLLTTVQSYTDTVEKSALAIGCWQKNNISKTPEMAAAVRMINSSVRDSAVMYISPANRKYTMRLPNSRLTKTTPQ